MSETVQEYGFWSMARFWGQAQMAGLQAQEDAAKAVADSFNQARATAERVIEARGIEAAPVPGAGPGPGPGSPTTARPQPSRMSTHFIKLSHSAADFWKSASDFSDSWYASAAANAGKGMTLFGGGLRGLADPIGASLEAHANGMRAGLAGQLIEGPRFADMLNEERRQARLMKAWLDFCKHSLARQAVIANVWIRASQNFSTALAKRTSESEATLDGKAVLALWVEIANRDLLKMQATDPFLAIQGALIRSAMELKLARQEVTDSWATYLDLPTRTELDDVHRTVTELRRELRLLKRQTLSRATPAQEEQPAPTIQPAPAPAAAAAAAAAADPAPAEPDAGEEIAAAPVAAGPVAAAVVVEPPPMAVAAVATKPVARPAMQARPPVGKSAAARAAAPKIAAAKRAPALPAAPKASPASAAASRTKTVAAPPKPRTGNGVVSTKVNGLASTKAVPARRRQLGP